MEKKVSDQQIVATSLYLNSSEYYRLGLLYLGLSTDQLDQCDIRVTSNLRQVCRTLETWVTNQQALGTDCTIGMLKKALQDGIDSNFLDINVMKVITNLPDEGLLFYIIAICYVEYIHPIYTLAVETRRE